MALPDGEEPGVGMPAVMPAALAALVLALEEQGALSCERFRDILVGFWTAMPEDEAFDYEAQICERLLAFLDGLPGGPRGSAPPA